MQGGMRRIGRTLFACAIASVCIIGLTTATPDAEAKKPGGGGGGGGTVCYDLWAPVLCPDGNVYSNACYASVAGQTGCVPWGPGGPVPI